MGRYKVDDIFVGDPAQAEHLEEFICPVCKSFFDEPVQLACTHIYCKNCIAPCEACPVCRDEICTTDGKKGRPLSEVNKPVLRMMNKMKVRCPHSAPDSHLVCEAVRASDLDGGSGGAGDGASASSSSSSSNQKQNPNQAGAAASSGQQGSDSINSPASKKRKVAESKSGKAKAKAKSAANKSSKGKAAAATLSASSADDVENCTWIGEYGDLLAHHLRICPFHLVDCPDGCGEKLQRCKIEEHLKTNCRLGFVQCHICWERLRNGDDAMRLHRQEKAALHVQLLEQRLKEEECRTRMAANQAQWNSTGALCNRLSAMEVLIRDIGAKVMAPEALAIVEWKFAAKDLFETVRKSPGKVVPAWTSDGVFIPQVGGGVQMMLFDTAAIYGKAGPNSEREHEGKFGLILHCPATITGELRVIYFPPALFGSHPAPGAQQCRVISSQPFFQECFAPDHEGIQMAFTTFGELKDIEVRKEVVVQLKIAKVHSLCVGTLENSSSSSAQGLNPEPPIDRRTFEEVFGRSSPSTTVPDTSSGTREKRGAAVPPPAPPSSTQPSTGGGASILGGPVLRAQPLLDLLLPRSREVESERLLSSSLSSSSRAAAARGTTTSGRAPGPSTSSIVSAPAAELLLPSSLSSSSRAATARGTTTSGRAPGPSTSSIVSAPAAELLLSSSLSSSSRAAAARGTTTSGRAGAPGPSTSSIFCAPAASSSSAGRVVRNNEDNERGRSFGLDDPFGLGAAAARSIIISNPPGPAATTSNPGGDPSVFDRLGLDLNNTSFGVDPVSSSSLFGIGGSGLRLQPATASANSPTTGLGASGTTTFVPSGSTGNGGTSTQTEGSGINNQFD